MFHIEIPVFVSGIRRKQQESSPIRGSSIVMTFYCSLKSYAAFRRYQNVRIVSSKPSWRETRENAWRMNVILNFERSILRIFQKHVACFFTSASKYKYSVTQKDVSGRQFRSRISADCLFYILITTTTTVTIKEDIL